MKTFTKAVLDKLGYQISKKGSANVAVGFNPSYLAQICHPSTVIDVGVAYGTHPLYRAFPAAKFILVEPLRDYESAIGEIAKKYDCDVFYKAVGDSQGTEEINVDATKLVTSTLADRTTLTATGGRLEKRLIEVTTLDYIYSQIPNIAKPILLKIDTEGYELKALRGAESLLRVTDTVIAEVSIAKRFEGGYEFEDLILFMKKSGFYVFSILSLFQPAGELRPRFADIVFKRRAERA